MNDCMSVWQRNAKTSLPKSKISRKNHVDFPSSLWYVFVLPKGGKRMNDYMTALLERFQIETPELSAYQARTAAAEAKLKETLDADQRKLLLHLADCQNTYRQEATLCGFLSGWKLANGLREELDVFPRFSIIDEDEARMLGRSSTEGE